MNKSTSKVNDVKQTAYKGINADEFASFSRVCQDKGIKITCVQTVNLSNPISLTLMLLKESGLHGVRIKCMFISGSFTSDRDGLTTICIYMDSHASPLPCWETGGNGLLGGEGRISTSVCFHSCQCLFIGNFSLFLYKMSHI